MNRQWMYNLPILSFGLYFRSWKEKNLPFGIIIWFKVGHSPSKKDFFIHLNDSPSKMMKNTFYFILKALVFLKIFKSLSWHFGHVGKTAWLEVQG